MVTCRKCGTQWGRKPSLETMIYHAKVLCAIKQRANKARDNPA